MVSCAHAKLQRGYARRKLKSLIARDGDKCHWCGRVMVPGAHDHQPGNMRTIDHLVEIRNGGDNRLSNLVLACSRCNNRRDKLQRESGQSDGEVEREFHT